MFNNLTLPPPARDLVERLGGSRRVAIAGVGLVTVLAILGIARWATAPTWVPVYSNLAIESVGSITERLDEERIPYRLESGGSALHVSANDLARARVVLAREGMPHAGRPGLEIFDQPAWGMTDFTQRVNYRRALEGELERTIGRMRAVEAVKVHVAMEETAGFRRSGRPSEASVVLKLSSGASPGADMVQGIAHLVSSSVDGVEPGRVTVLDDTGRLLSNPYEQDSSTAFASRELRARSDLEQYLGTKAEELVAQIVGRGNVRVQVAAELNLDRVERTVESVDPDRQALSSEQRSEIVPGAEGGAGSSSVTSTFLNSRSFETYTGAVGNVKRVTAAVLVNDRFVAGEGGGGVYEARSPEEIASIQALVANAMGIDAQRGDVVTVVSFPFDEPTAVESAPGIWDLVGQFHRPAIALIALLLTFGIGLRVTRTLRTPGGPAAEDAGRGGRLDLLVGEPGPKEQLEGAGTVPALPSTPASPRELVAAHIEEKPETAVKMVRAWMKEEA